MNTTRNNSVDLRQLLNPEKVIWPYSERENHTSLAPFSLELHLTSFCNYNCYHCSYQNRRSNLLVVNESNIKKLVSDIIDMEINGVYWSGGGEPTTIENFPTYIEEIANSKTEQALITNGILIHDQWISLLKRFNYIAISFQASKNSTYKKITGHNLRDRLYSNVRKLRGVLEDTILGARCVINRHNYKEVGQIYKDAKDLGFDYLIFIPAVDYEGRGDVELDIEEQDCLIEIVKDLAPSLDDSFTNLKRMMSLGVSHYKKDEKGGFPCYANYIRGTGFINYDGGVWLCQPHIGNPKYCIGNINKHRLIEIWNSEMHCKVIELLDVEHKRGNCRNCRSIAYNNVLHNYILTGNGTTFYDPFL
jgi:radical SAM protein with 4Fe4S-binding SPASM domain